MCKSKNNPIFSSAILPNKAGYTATLVACRWAGAVFELLKHLGKRSEAKDRKNIKKIKWGPTDRPTNRLTDRPTDRPTDKAGCRVACTRLKKKSRRSIGRTDKLRWRNSVELKLFFIASIRSVNEQTNRQMVTQTDHQTESLNKGVPIQRQTDNLTNWHSDKATTQRPDIKM